MHAALGAAPAQSPMHAEPARRTGAEVDDAAPAPVHVRDLKSHENGDLRARRHSLRRARRASAQLLQDAAPGSRAAGAARSVCTLQQRTFAAWQAPGCAAMVSQARHGRGADQEGSVGHVQDEDPGRPDHVQARQRADQRQAADGRVHPPAPAAPQHRSHCGPGHGRVTRLPEGRICRDMRRAGRPIGKTPRLGLRGARPCRHAGLGRQGAAHNKPATAPASGNGCGGRPWQRAQQPRTAPGAAARAPALAHLERHVAALRAAHVPRADLARQQALVVVVVVYRAAAAARRGAPPSAASRRLGCVSERARRRERAGASTRSVQQLNGGRLGRALSGTQWAWCTRRERPGQRLQWGTAGLGQRQGRWAAQGRKGARRPRGITTHETTPGPSRRANVSL